MKTLFCLQKIGLIFVISILKLSATKAQLVVDNDHYQIDNNLRIIVCNVIPDNNKTTTTSITLGETYVFSNPINKIQIGIGYKVARNDTLYKLYFTQLPIVSLNTKNSIIGDAESGSFIQIADTIGTPYNSAIGIKLRGSYSRTFPKKSYHIRLWTDSTGSATKDDAVFDMRSDDTWLLLAMYNEKLRLNNKVSHDLWLKLHKLYYADLEPDAHSTIRSRYVEVFLNADYQGVYLLSEDMDRKQLKLKKQTTADTGGELYKGTGWDDGTLFTGLPALPTGLTQTWGGWEVSYPDATNWVNLHAFTDFAVNATDSLFKQQSLTKIRSDNFADYFIFLNLLRAEDNQGKNLFLARYTETSPYFIAPWDLDGTWGYYWSGDQKNVTNDLLTNNLFNRLLTTDSFKLQLATRWFSLRSTILSADSLSTAIGTNHNFLMTNGVYERENMKWAGDLLSYGQDELNYIQNWTQMRLAWLDTYFKSLVSDKPIIYSFNVAAQSASVGLNWSANCSAISSFDAEVSSDNLIWHIITPASIMTNDSVTCNYTFMDHETKAGIAYYRLKVTDKNNGISYGPVQRIRIEWPSSTVSIYPNPTSATLQIQGDVAKISIYSSLGACVYESPSSTSNVIDVQRFTAGLYLVRVTQKNGAISSHKVVVNR